MMENSVFVEKKQYKRKIKDFLLAEPSRDKKDAENTAMSCGLTSGTVIRTIELK